MSNLSETPIARTGRLDAARRPHLPVQLRVLVADDEPLFRWAVANALEASGHVVVTAAAGYSALDAVSRAHFDVALIDCHLADGRDLALLRDMHTIAPELPVVATTALPSEELARRAHQLGAIRILEKPFDVFSLERVLRNACAARSRVP